MPRSIPVPTWKVYFDARDDGLSITKAASRAGIGKDAAYAFERGQPSSSGRTAAILLGRHHVGGSEVVHVEADATKALGDFSYFRLRYFGRRSTPWQERAAYEVLRHLESDRKEFAVINMPPGSGKSTLFTHDIPAWLIARRRSIRILLGSRTGRQATMYAERLRGTLGRTQPLTADSEAVRTGMAQDAVATLHHDFGAFRPEGRELQWTSKQFYVVQNDGQVRDDKEPTVSAFGQEEGSLGWRGDLAIWDDLVDYKNVTSRDAWEKLLTFWQQNAERRIEPGGLLLLQGQRIAPNDLYRWALNVRTADGSPKYHHVVYPAHNDEACHGQHGAKAKAWPDGCLLDPHRLPWTELENVRTQDPRVYDIQYQQRDGSATGSLVDPLWVYGGQDDSGVYPGCLDNTRARLAVPEGISDRPLWSVVSVDPSPTNWWAVQWWLVDPTDPRAWLMTTSRRRMSNLEFLTHDPDTGTYTGLLQDMLEASRTTPYPLQHVVVEVNAAQKWLLSQPYVQKWAMLNQVTFLPHTTASNKTDPTFGVQSTAAWYRQGRINIPNADPRTRVEVKPLVDQVLAWPEGREDDQVMAQWFMVRAATFQYAPRQSTRPTLPRPSWVRKAGRGLPTALGRVG